VLRIAILVGVILLVWPIQNVLAEDQNVRIQEPSGLNVQLVFKPDALRKLFSPVPRTPATAGLATIGCTTSCGGTNADGSTWSNSCGTPSGCKDCIQSVCTATYCQAGCSP
jgi:hypothetical protein